MAQLSPHIANRIAAGSRTHTSQGGGNDRVRASVLPSDPDSESFANPSAATRSARRARAGSSQKRRDDREATATHAVVLDAHPGLAAVVKSQPTGCSTKGDTLSESDVSNLKAVLDHEIASSTLNNYRIQWGNFLSWALEKGVRPLPADPAQVAPRTWRNASWNTATSRPPSGWRRQR